MTTIRIETRTDHDEIRRVITAAFGVPGEAALVDALRINGGLTLSLVAESEGKIVGHIAFSPVTVGDSAKLNAIGLGPMAVLPECQRQGIGSRLIKEGRTRLRDDGHRIVVVLGHPDYYPRFGFAPSKPLGIEWEHPAPEDAFMVLPLRPGALSGVRGTVRYRPEFDNV